jgi:hypothetical protein
MRYGESMTREGLPDEVLLQIMRRADAEQSRYVNLARIADALENPADSHSVPRQVITALERIADALDRAFPVPAVEEAADDSAA